MSSEENDSPRHQIIDRLDDIDMYGDNDGESFNILNLSGKLS